VGQPPATTGINFSNTSCLEFGEKERFSSRPISVQGFLVLAVDIAHLPSDRARGGLERSSRRQDSLVSEQHVNMRLLSQP
jgi:hypothetical protein